MLSAGWVMPVLRGGQQRKASLATSLDIDMGAPLDLGLGSFGVRGQGYTSGVGPALVQTRVLEPAKPEKPEKRARNVLRRRPSATATHAPAMTAPNRHHHPTIASSPLQPTGIPGSARTGGGSAATTKPSSSTSPPPPPPPTSASASVSAIPTANMPGHTHDRAPRPSPAHTTNAIMNNVNTTTTAMMTTPRVDDPPGKRASTSRTPIYAALATVRVHQGQGGAGSGALIVCLWCDWVLCADGFLFFLFG